MDTLSAYANSLAARGRPFRVFDWHRAAALIRAGGVREAGAGLSGDWEYTGGTIFRDGAPVPRSETYVYLASNWATPELELDGVRLDCWRWRDDTPGWDADTYWPESAIAILNGGTT